jgi:hypothetical protein
MRSAGPARAIPSEEKNMTLNLFQLACLSAALGLSACTTTPKVVDDGAIKDTCQCNCKWSTVDGSQAVGTLTFPPQGQTCSFVAVDNYVPCNDDQGDVHPGTSYSDCRFVPGVLPPSP